MGKGVGGLGTYIFYRWRGVEMDRDFMMLYHKL